MVLLSYAPFSKHFTATNVNRHFIFILCFYQPRAGSIKGNICSASETRGIQTKRKFYCIPTKIKQYKTKLMLYTTLEGRTVHMLVHPPVYRLPLILSDHRILGAFQGVFNNLDLSLEIEQAIIR